MTVDSSTPLNPSDANTKCPKPLRCKHPRCKCLREAGQEYCSSCCKENPETATYCTCTHEGCYCECDLVMKGGVTSGIVYPPLVYKLHENNYRFRNIGGTSAGAIMAAITAAAEYGRVAGGFEKLNRIKEQLGKDNFLSNLFQPSKETRPLYKFLMDSAEVAKGKDKSAGNKGIFIKIWRLAGKLQRAAPLEFALTYVLGALTGLGIAYLFILMVNGGVVTDGGGVVLLIFGLLGALAGYLVAFGIGGHGLFKILTRKIPDNHFGMCTGMKDESMPQNQQVLTNWLNDSINDLSGMTDKRMPLTFGMLKEKEFAKKREHEDGINLRMMTSNLSQNQPYVLPFADQFLLYNEVEFKKFFPDEIVEYMKEIVARRKQESPPKPTYDLSRIPGYFFLPAANDLPVIVATRLSLSFPLLLCALPLYTIIPDKLVTDETKENIQLEKSHLKLNWFSDGGIASNFPIQFFDTWLPTRPSFGINLTSLPDEGFKEESKGEKERPWWDIVSPKQREKKVVVRSEYSSPTADTSGKKAKAVTGEVEAKTVSADKDAIYLPAADDLLFTEWIPLTKKSPKSNEEVPNLFKFVWAIFTTAQNYRDNMQAMLPSYRERIVQIRLSDDEGGLNLAMRDETIKNVMEKGEEAGRVLLEHFDFRVHQWVRFQVLMSQMEKYLETTLKVASPDPKTNTRQFDYPALLEAQKAQAANENRFPYRREKEWCDIALHRMETMGDFIRGWPEKPRLSDEPPLPESVLRVTPEI